MAREGGGVPSVLLVEDTKAVRAIVGVYLSGWPIHLLEAEDGAEGLRVANELLPDLIITDVQMPKMDGFELCAAVRSHEKLADVPLVLLTGLKDDAARKKGELLGVNAFLTKPIKVDELTSKLKELLNISR